MRIRVRILQGSSVTRRNVSGWVACMKLITPDTLRVFINRGTYATTATVAIFKSGRRV